MITPMGTPLQATLTGQDDLLHANNDAYEYLVGKILATDRSTCVEAILRNIEKAAQFAVESHTGRFADGAIENVALQIGVELDTAVAGKNQDFILPPTHHESRHILHVTTTVYEVGGHTRMLCHWVRKDLSSCHSVVLVNQNNEAIPSMLSEAVRDSGGTIIAFPPGSRICQKAAWLREIAKQNIDLVVMHHFGSDIVPTVAFAVPECPPVVILNHADHLFWVGSSVADMVISLRTAGAEYTKDRRFISCNHILPVPLTDTEGEISREDARSILGIGEDQVVLLSIGRAEKYRPSGQYDFVATANKILEQQPNAYLYVIGESVAGISRHLRYALHERLYFVGSIEDPSLYRVAADVYLESFPFGSQTALLEAALSGLPVVPAYAPLFPLLVANDDALKDILHNPHDEQEYINRVELLIRQPEHRVAMGVTLRNCLLVNHVGEGWLNRLTSIYKETDRLVHNPQPIFKSPCYMTNADISLSQWHAMAGRTYSTGSQGDAEGTILFHTAFVSKAVGNYATARKYAWLGVQHTPYRRSAWRLLAVTLLGKGWLIRWVKMFRTTLRRGTSGGVQRWSSR
ncbi:MAG: glycosyltransferase [Methyloprofundus sp.]|nr:glycosyltransferase [Methyloprofundus sp.]